MATKTLTITEDAYVLLKQHKASGESFSEELLRILAQKRKKNLATFFGIFSDQEGELMQNNLERARSINLRLLQERMKS